jgi:hypothetical protein
MLRRCGFGAGVINDLVNDVASHNVTFTSDGLFSENHSCTHVAEPGVSYCSYQFEKSIMKSK